jgi:hypothetical protein
LFIVEAIEIMESCGLQYTPSVNTDLGQSSFSKNSQPWKKPFPAAASSASNNSNRKPPFSKSSSTDYNVLLNDQMILTLEPNIELLVNYRHIPSSSEKANSFPGSKPPQQYCYNHPYLPSELKHLIYIEQRKYSIRKKVVVLLFVSWLVGFNTNVHCFFLFLSRCLGT